MRFFHFSVQFQNTVSSIWIYSIGTLGLLEITIWRICAR